MGGEPKEPTGEQEQPTEEQGQPSEKSLAHEEGIQAALRAGRMYEEFNAQPESQKEKRFKELVDEAQVYGIDTNNLGVQEIIIEIVRRETQQILKSKE